MPKGLSKNQLCIHANMASRTANTCMHHIECMLAGKGSSRKHRGHCRETLPKPLMSLICASGSSFGSFAVGEGKVLVLVALVVGL